ncbi:glycoside hydrolase family 5 protein [Streptomyces sp. DSM 42041]|uniref:cellulase n=1 Tax=Streptomyces hazeniae TaxID=3075538 RepID=A0ABU2NK48_9ACTN|nr:glycoside hydrolase family 5 protein [Streptomyces sp. DSM 42041]MDT0377371.1 glycoside hydrolase family 5 protein [Streptomyces sp. DSM 42041]
MRHHHLGRARTGAAALALALTALTAPAATDAFRADAAPAPPAPSTAPAPAPPTAVPPPAPDAAPAGSPVAEHGRLSVCARTLCDSRGRAVQLTGMSTHGTQWYAQCVTEGSLDVLAQEWDADVLRVSTYVQEGGYETDPEGFTRLAQRIVDQAIERGMYAVIDWHMLSPGDPHANTGSAKRFFTDMASRYADHPNVFYEIANEPNGVSWQRIRSYAEELVPVVRAQDPDGVVLVGTRAWSSFGVSEGADEQEVVADPVDAENIMYTFHFYAASHREEYLRTLEEAADRLPVFVTEFGTQDYAGEGPNDFTMAQRYLDLMAEKNISWTNWNFSDDHRSGAVFREGTCAAGDWGGADALKESGAWIRDRIRS